MREVPHNQGTDSSFIPVVAYIEGCILLPEKKLVKLAEHQRNILNHVLTPVDCRLPYTTILWSEPKKSGKTAIAAWVASWALNMLGPRAEVLVVGNDFEQGQARVFAEVVRVQRAHPALRQRLVKVTDSLLLLDDGSTCRPVALDAPGEAGANPSLVVHDEAWGITSERARRLYDELTPPPTRPLACRWVTSYAGNAGESAVLEELYRRGLSGKPVRGLDDLPCYAAGSLFMFWSNTPRMPWQTEQYYRSQQAELRPRAFLRLHRNEWVTTEGTFLDLTRLEAAIERGVIERPAQPGMRYAIFVDNSGGSNDDMTLGVGHREGDLRVIDAVYDQGGKVPFNPNHAIARFAEVARRYRVSKITGDTFGGKFFQSEYEEHGIAYDVCPLSPSELYESLEVPLNTGAIRLIHHARVIEQLGALIEKGGRITHKYGAHDDYANVVAGCLWVLGTWTQSTGPWIISAGSQRLSATGLFGFSSGGRQDFLDGLEGWPTGGSMPGRRCHSDW